MKAFGITGRKNSGKTTLVTRLVTHFSEQGFDVSTIKHAHHDAMVDHPGTDSYAHRVSGASEVLLATPTRWALMHEYRGEPQVGLDALLQRLTPVDLVLVEGFKTSDIPKIEAYRGDKKGDLLAVNNPSIVGIASDCDQMTLLPKFHLDDVESIAQFIRQCVDL